MFEKRSLKQFQGTEIHSHRFALHDLGRWNDDPWSLDRRYQGRPYDDTESLE